MMYYIIASHGTYAESCKSSCEMITGSAPSFIPVVFEENMTKENVEQAYRKILDEKGPHDCAGIIVDLLGGTPYNAAMRIVAEYANVQIIPGLCQQLLVLLNSGESLSSAIEQIQLLFANISINKIEESVKYSSAEIAQKNGIVNLRLDERLIHGQVATFWTRTLEADRIMIVDDDLLKDKIGVDALKTAVPSGVHLSILSVENASKRLNAGLYSGQRVFLLVNKTETIIRLIETGVKVKEVNIGNMGDKDGRRQIKKSVYCTPREIEDIKALEKAGVKVLAQMVPKDEKRTFSSFLNK